MAASRPGKMRLISGGATSVSPLAVRQGPRLKCLAEADVELVGVVETTAAVERKGDVKA